MRHRGKTKSEGERHVNARPGALMHGVQRPLNPAHRLSRTKKCNMAKLAAVNVTKKMPSSDMFGHQNDCARRPNVERIVAVGTSSSTPY